MDMRTAQITEMDSKPVGSGIIAKSVAVLLMVAALVVAIVEKNVDAVCGWTTALFLCWIGHLRGEVHRERQALVEEQKRYIAQLRKDRYGV